MKAQETVLGPVGVIMRQVVVVGAPGGPLGQRSGFSNLSTGHNTPDPQIPDSARGHVVMAELGPGPRTPDYKKQG